MLKKLALISVTAILSSSAALAHVSLEKAEAPVGSTYKAVLRVPHGCAGQPTNIVRVKIPAGVIAVKPMPKAGWQLEKKRGEYGTTYDYYGTPTTEGVTEVIWSGGNLGDDEYDEFVLRGYLTTHLKAGDMLYFPVVQQCPDNLTERWVEIPADGQTSDDLELPAPGLKLLEKKHNH